MKFDPISRGNVMALWNWMAPILEPAVAHDPGVGLEDVRLSLVNGPDLCVVVSDGAEGVIVMEITEDRECWVKYVAGKISGGPKARFEFMKQGLAHIERAAVNAGCLEVRVCGRDWSVILTGLTGYRLMPDWPNGLRKVLSPMSNEKEAA